MTEVPGFDGLRLVLPRRRRLGLPGFALLTWLPVAFGLLTAGVAVTVVLVEANWGGAARRPDWSWLIVTPFAVVGIALLAVAHALYSSHAVVELDDTWLRTEERLGFVRLRRRCARAGITGLTVEDLPIRIEGRPWPAVGALRVRCPNEFRVGYAYPTRTLVEVAVRLRMALGLPESAVERALDPPVGSPKVVDGASVLPDATLPVTSLVRVTHRSDGLSMWIPPTGFRGAARSALIVGVGCVVLGTTNGVAFTLVPLADQPGWLGFVGLGAFVLVGLLIAGQGYLMARRRVTIEVVGGRMQIEHVSPLGVRRYEWAPGDVARVLVTDSSLIEDEVHLRQLRIEGRDGRAVTLLTGRVDAELSWIAGQLSVCLGLRQAAV